MSNGENEMVLAKTPRWLKLLLILSLSANLLVAGLFIGSHLGGFNVFGDKRQSWVFRVLPKERHEEAKAILRQNRDKIVGQVAQMNRVHQDIAAAIAAEPMDPAVLEAAFATRREKVVEFHGLIQGQLVLIVSRLTVEERQMMAKKLLKSSSRWAKRRAKLTE